MTDRAGKLDRNQYFDTSPGALRIIVQKNGIQTAVLIAEPSTKSAQAKIAHEYLDKMIMEVEK